MPKKMCSHRNWVCAGYKYIHPGGEIDIRVQSIYHVYCPNCGHFVNLLTKEYIDDKGLTSPIHLDPEIRKRYSKGKE